MKYKKKSTATIDQRFCDYIQTASERKVNSDILTTEVAGIDVSENGIEYIYIDCNNNNYCACPHMFVTLRVLLFGSGTVEVEIIDLRFGVNFVALNRINFTMALIG